MTERYRRETVAERHRGERDSGIEIEERKKMIGGGGV